MSYSLDELAAIASDHLSTTSKKWGKINALAEVAEVHHSTVCTWRRYYGPPVNRALIISQKLNIPLHMIRPDIWKPPS